MIQRQRRRVSFPDRQTGTLPELWRETRVLTDQLGDSALGRLIEGVEISSAGTTVAHGLRAIPRAVYVTCQEDNDGIPYRYRAADEKNVYLRAVKTSFLNTFQGRNGAGAITCVGLQVGDVVEALVGVLPVGIVGSGASQFESTITVADQIQQTSAANLTTINYLLTVRRAATVTCDLLVVP